MTEQKEYIDRTQFCEFFCRCNAAACAEMAQQNKKCPIFICPTADVAPVKHGKWINLEPEIGLFECALCEHTILRAKCNYCPNCGAKMDLED